MGMNKSVGTAPILILILAAALLGCTTEGQVGMIIKSSVEVASLLQSGRTYEEQGSVRGIACHYHVLLIPFGNSNIAAAVDRMLEEKDADALIQVTTSKWYAGIPLFFFIPSLFERACTTVTGAAIRFFGPKETFK